jgi:hypothetical protein
MQKKYNLLSKIKLPAARYGVSGERESIGKPEGTRKEVGKYFWTPPTLMHGALPEVTHSQLSQTYTGSNFTTNRRERHTPLLPFYLTCPELFVMLRYSAAEQPAAT